MEKISISEKIVYLLIIIIAGIFVSIFTIEYIIQEEKIDINLMIELSILIGGFGMLAFQIRSKKNLILYEMHQDLPSIAIFSISDVLFLFLYKIVPYKLFLILGVTLFFSSLFMLLIFFIYYPVKLRS